MKQFLDGTGIVVGVGVGKLEDISLESALLDNEELLKLGLEMADDELTSVVERVDEALVCEETTVDELD